MSRDGGNNRLSPEQIFLGRFNAARGAWPASAFTYRHPGRIMLLSRVWMEFFFEDGRHRAVNDA